MKIHRTAMLTMLALQNTFFGTQSKASVDIWKKLLSKNCTFDYCQIFRKVVPKFCSKAQNFFTRCIFQQRKTKVVVSRVAKITLTKPSFFNSTTSKVKSVRKPCWSNFIVPVKPFISTWKKWWIETVFKNFLKIGLQNIILGLFQACWDTLYCSNSPCR